MRDYRYHYVRAGGAEACQTRCQAMEHIAIAGQDEPNGQRNHNGQPDGGAVYDDGYIDAIVQWLRLRQEFQIQNELLQQTAA